MQSGAQENSPIHPGRTDEPDLVQRNQRNVSSNGMQKEENEKSLETVKHRQYKNCKIEY